MNRYSLSGRGGGGVAGYSGGQQESAGPTSSSSIDSQSGTTIYVFILYIVTEYLSGRSCKWLERYGIFLT